jgi:hypothetical protein
MLPKREPPIIRITLLLFLIVFMLLGTGANALSAPRYQIETATISGGGYRLTSFAMQADNIAAGGGIPLVRTLGAHSTGQRLLLRLPALRLAQKVVAALPQAGTSGSVGPAAGHECGRSSGEPRQ